MNKKISVVVPIYNVEKYLEKCITSIINQSYKNLEIILVNDGSTDNCKAICERWLKKDNRIIFIDKKNGGLSSARNAGIESSTGDYITFIDSDDYFELDAIEIMVEKIENNNCDIVICNRYYLEENGKKYLKYCDNNNTMIMNKKEAIIELNSFNYFDMSAWGKLYKSELFKKIRFPEGKICEDYYIMYKLFDLCEKVVYFSKPILYYLQRKGSITKKNDLKYDFVHAAKEQMQYIEEKYPDLKIYVRTAYASANMTIYSQNIINGGKCDKKIYDELRKNVKNNIEYIYKNEKISFSKKIQAFLFVNFPLIYNFIYKIYKLLKK